jgi:hypothetical protein
LRRRTKEVWLVKVAIRQATGDPWLLLTDWPVTDADAAVRIFRFYRLRWAVEDTFKFVKNAFGTKDVQMLKLKAVRWEERPNRPPGKITLTRGLSRILDMLATEAVLDDFAAQHGDLLPFVKQLLAKR